MRPSGIKTLKRYVADHQKGPDALRFTRDLIARPLPPDMRVAVVGAGPAGIACAYHLLLHGYHVDILEALDEAGGMAAIGIPSYRLPKDVLHSETDIITALGGRFLFNQAMGRDFGIDDLFARGYRAVFLALGCQQGIAHGRARRGSGAARLRDRHQLPAQGPRPHRRHPQDPISAATWWWSAAAMSPWTARARPCAWAPSGCI